LPNFFFFKELLLLLFFVDNSIVGRRVLNLGYFRWKYQEVSISCVDIKLFNCNFFYRYNKISTYGNQTAL